MSSKDIRMVDLNGQYLKIKKEIDSAIYEVINSTSFIKGPAVKKFQEELENYLDLEEVIPCGNGTDALQAAMMALDLKPGDEVITTPFTFISTIEVIKLLKLKPVLADVNPDDFIIDPDEIRKVLNPKVKAIVPVHLFGQCANMDDILDIGRENNLKIIEDTAQAIGSNYFFKDGSSKKAGTIGDIGTTSFFPSKNLGAFGDGGAIFTRNSELAEKLRAMVNHGMKRRYYYDYVGMNSRLDSIQAALLSVKLRHLDEYIHARQTAAGWYDSALKNHEMIQIPFRNSFSDHGFHQYTIKVSARRNELKEYLNSNGIPAMIYYPVGLHLQEAYKDLGYRPGDFPVTESLSEQVLSLPMHTELTKNQIDFITEKILEFFKK